jgi:hypothetical protein
MPDEALDNAVPSNAHFPWDSIGGSDESIESMGRELSEPEEDAASSLTPWAERSAAPDSEDCGLPIVSCGPVKAGSAISIRNPQSEIRNSSEPSRGGGWTIPALCAGIALIACSVLIPQADANRRLAYEKETLTRDLHSIEMQIDVNREFLKKVGDDPTLAQRLAERQMKVIPQGAHVLDLTHDSEVMSPFQLLNVASPAPLPPYRSVGGTLARICYGPQSRLYLIGMSLGLIAMGLVLGSGPQDDRR